jgi:hypothetical protein
MQDFRNKFPYDGLHAYSYYYYPVEEYILYIHPQRPCISDQLLVSTGYIEDRRLYEFWLKLFLYGNFKIKSWACSKLAGSREDQLKEYNQQLRRGIELYRYAACEEGENEDGVNKELCTQWKDKKVPYEDIPGMMLGDELYMRLPLSAKEKVMFLKKVPNFPGNYPIRARLGDTLAEQKLIAAFKQETNFIRKTKMPILLGLAGTPACAKALVAEIDSPLIIKMKNSYTSMLVYVIKALGMIHPEEKFLRFDINYIETNGDKNYGGPKKIAEYIDKVRKWAERTYHIKFKNPKPEPLLNGLPLVGGFD